jgi:quinoprotein glucose dehydrogenase
MRKRWLALAVLAMASIAHGEPLDATEWPSYGNDPGGMRYVPLDQIDRRNVSSLEIAWVARTGDQADGRPPFETTSAFELTPILVQGTLYACTPFNRVLALDPITGRERWSFDPEIDRTGNWANQFVCRGVSAWEDRSARPGSECRLRIFTATLDARLIALDSESGTPCGDFGAGGSVDLNPGVGEQAWRGEYSITSPPALAGDLVIVGSAVGDNARVEAPSGVVRAYDARSGRLRWAWDLAPPDQPGGGRAAASGYMLSTPNVWAPMAVDEARDLLFVPTGNPTPDYASGHRQGLDHYGSSVVALRASTGRVVWHFQTVHHDVWDYDVPAQPTLFPLRRDEREIPALAQGTKMGMLFFFERQKGAPLFPIDERPVPQGAEPGFVLSPTQPFPRKPPPLVRHALAPEHAWGVTLWDRGWCRGALEALRYEGIYTPPTVQGTLMYPGNAGGTNWGGIAVDPERQLLVANVSDFPFAVTLIPHERFEEAVRARPEVEYGAQRGASHAMRREPLLSPLGVPCSPPPWGTLHAVDLRSGELRWTVPLGTLRDALGVPFLPIPLGLPNLGGPLVTASGLVFIGAAFDDYLRAYDVETGDELWRGRLPAGGQATPMSYLAGGRQFVVIAAGGHGRAGTRLGDAIVAYALPAP